MKFDVRGIIQLYGGKSERAYGKTRPDRVAGIVVDRKCHSLHFLHGACSAQFTSGVRIGAYLIQYADGEIIEIPLVEGKDVADWWTKRGESGEVSHAAIAWIGMNEAILRAAKYGALHLYRLTWKNPRPAVKVSSIDFVLSRTLAGPFLIALTAEPQP